MRFWAVFALIVLITLAFVMLRRAATGGAAGSRRAASSRRVAGGAGALPAVDWDGPAGCYPAAAVADCLAAARAVGGFGPADPAGQEALAAAAERISEKHGVGATAASLAAARNMEVALATRRAAPQAARHGAAMRREYEAGEAVLAIAGRRRLPPVAAMRQILAELGHSSARVRDMVASPAKLPPRMAAEAAAIFEADLGSRPNADRIRAAAQEYEDAVGRHLRRLGLDFKTEAALRAEGETALTPDFLLVRPAVFRVPGRPGAPVHWLDAKNYPAFDSRLTSASLERQAAKYTAAFGPGAMVFNGGVMCGARAGRPALLLDGSHLAPG